MNINDFKYSLQPGPARPNRYQVHVFPPLAMIAEFGSVARSFSFLCDNATWPGTLIATSEDKIWGPIRKMPYLNTFEDLRFSFICTENMEIRKFFDAWQQKIINRDNFLVSYYDQYAKDARVRIVLLGQDDNPIHGIICEECFPVEVVSQPLAYEETDTYLKVEVVMAYRQWKEDPIVNIL